MSKECFQYMHLRFDIGKAKRLAKQYRPKEMKPKDNWYAPLLEKPPLQEMDLTAPVIFATLIFIIDPGHLLIDGAKRLRWALEQDKKLSFVVLDLPDTFKVLTGDAKLKRNMRKHGKRLGLL